MGQSVVCDGRGQNLSGCLKESNVYIYSICRLNDSGNTVIMILTNIRHVTSPRCGGSGTDVCFGICVYMYVYVFVFVCCAIF